MYIPKIHKRLKDVPGRPVISNCGTSTEKVSEFLDYYLKLVMQAQKSYVKDTSDFLQKLRNLGGVPDNAILASADVVALYSSIPHEDCLKYLFERLEEREVKQISSEDLVQMAKFLPKNNFFEFDTKVKQQISGTAIGTQFAPPYACIFMDGVETEFLEKEPVKPWLWLCYIDDIFSIWTGSEGKLAVFMARLDMFHPNFKFTWESSRSAVNFLDVVVGIEGENFVTDVYYKPTDFHQFLHYESSQPIHIKRSIVCSQGLRIKRICSNYNLFLT